jgi:hypothetical protein
VNPSPLHPTTSNRRPIGFNILRFIVVALGFLALWTLHRNLEVQAGPAKIEQALGLTLPPSVTQADFSLGGFIDTQIRAKFELSKRDLSGFLTANRLDLNGSLRSIQEAETGSGWWQPQQLLQAKTYGLADDGSVRQPSTTTGFYVNVLIGQEDLQGDQFTVYIAASDD